MGSISEAIDGVAASIPAPEQLQSIEVARVMHLISEGECVGLADSANPAKSVFFKNTALQDSSGTYNYPNVTVDQRLGTANQSYIPGFSSAESGIVVNTEVRFGLPITRTVSSAAIDAARIDVQFPLGLQVIDSQGNRQPGSVQVTVSTKLTASGTWNPVINDTIRGKAEQGFEKSYYVARPAGTGAWDVKVDRLTADTTTPTTVADKTFFYRLTEIQDVKQTYPHSAYVALSYDAKTAPDSAPQTFDWIGVKVAVPSNYNPTTRAYTGVWDGTLSATKGWTYNSVTRMWDDTVTGTLYWTDNPVWHLYDLLTNKRYGAGDLGIDPTTIDLASFYAASVYCDELVPINSSTEPRFRFNCQITQQDDMWKVIQMLASTFNAVVYASGGLVKLVQDRPTAPSVLVTKSNISAEGFNYSSSAGTARHTAARVTYNDPNNSFAQTSVTYYESSSSFPYNVVDLVAWGCTSEGQARRVARWAVDTELRNTDVVSYKAPLSHINVEPGTVIKVMDNDWANSVLAAKVVSVVGTTVTLDRPVAITSGTNLIDVRLADGVTVEQRTVSTGAGSAAVLTIASAFSQAVPAGSDAIVSGSIVPRLFRVTDIKEANDGFYEVSALQYDPTKYSRVETGTSTAPQVYSDVSSTTVPGPVTGLTFTLQAASATDTVFRDLNLTWTKPTGASTYTVQYRLRGEQWTQVGGIGTATFTIRNVVTGTYDVNVYALSKWGLQSPVTSGSYGVDLSGSTVPVISPVTGLSVLGGGTSFAGQDLTVVWTNPTANASKNPALKDFVVNVYTTAGVLLRSEVVPAVPAGLTQTYTYTYSKNLIDGGPRRSVRVDVQARDALNSLVTAVTGTFSNPAPATLSSISVVGGVGNVKLTYTKPAESDLAGVLIWRSTSSGFTPSAGNFIYETGDNYVSDPVTFGTTYYYRLAAYDSFGKPLDGAGLNISAQVSGAALSADGIPEVSALPSPTGYSGPRIVFLTTDGQLYSYVSGAWQATIPPVSGIADGSVTIAKFAAGLRPVEVLGSLPTTGNTVGRLVFLTGDNKLYRYNGTSFVATVASTDLTGTLTDAQLSAISAAKITGTIVTSQIADAALTTAKFASGITPVEIGGTLPSTGNFAGRQYFLTTDGKVYRYNGSAWVSSVPAADITGTLTNAQLADIAAAKITGQITGTQITDNAISTPKIAAGSITTAKIAADAVTANEIAANAVTATELAAGSVTTSKLVAGAVTANELAANSVVAGKIAAGAVSATEIAAGAITTSKLLVVGKGMAMNDDPSFTDPTAWIHFDGAYPNITNIGDGVAGYGVARFTNMGAIRSRAFAVAEGRTYRVSAYARRTAGAGTMYLRLQIHDGANNLLQYVVLMQEPTAGAIENIAVPNTWTKYVGTAVAPASSVYGFGVIYANFNTSGVTDIQDLRIEEAVQGSLIVDGTITGTKILAGSITAANIAGDTITAAQIAAGAVTTAELAAGSVTTSKLVAGAVTANELAANSVVAGKVQAGAISAAEIAVGAIRAQHLAIAPKSLNVDPSFESGGTVWTGFVQRLPAANPAVPAGCPVAYASQFSLRDNPSQLRLDVVPGEVFRASCWVNRGTASAVGAGLGIYGGTRDAAGATVSDVAWTATTASGWQRVSGTYTIPAGAATLIFGTWADRPTYTGEAWYADLAIEKVNDASLIVDGTITASKIAAGAITSNELAANSVTAGKLAASSVTASNIVAGTITGDKLVANTVTGDKVAAGTITATNIDSRNLTIKDGAGTVIFSAGTPLAAANADPALRNSSITVDGSGVLGGIGTNGVTVDNRAAVIGQNLFPNSDATSAHQWQAGYNPNGASIDQGPRYAAGYGGWTTANFVLAAGTTQALFVHQNGVATGTADGSGNGAVATDLYVADSIVAAVPGQRVCASAYLQAHRCDAYVFIGFYDTTGAALQYAFSAVYNGAGGPANTLANMTRVSVLATAPAGTASMSMRIRKMNTYTAGGDSYLWWAAPQLETVGALAAGPGPYMAGPPSSTRQLGFTGDLNSTYGATFGSNISGQITAGTASTYIASAAIGSAQIANAAISSAQIQDAAVTNAKIQDAAITNAKIGSAAIQSANIGDLQVGTIKIASGAISTTYSASSAGATASVTVSVPTGSRGVVAMAFLGGEIKTALVTDFSGDKGGSYSYYVTRAYAALGTVSASTYFGSNTSLGSCALAGNDPPGGTYTFTATRYDDTTNPGSYTAWSGNITIVVIVTQR